MQIFISRFWITGPIRVEECLPLAGEYLGDPTIYALKDEYFAQSIKMALEIGISIILKINVLYGGNDFLWKERVICANDIYRS